MHNCTFDFYLYAFFFLKKKIKKKVDNWCYKSVWLFTSTIAEKLPLFEYEQTIKACYCLFLENENKI
jgi:hypothetical protein